MASEWPLLTGGHYSDVVVRTGLTVDCIVICENRLICAKRATAQIPSEALCLRIPNKEFFLEIEILKCSRHAKQI
jgi:hypothetical protein